MPKRFVWRLYPSYLIIIILSLAAVAIYASYVMHRIDVQKETSKLLISSRLLADSIEKPLAANDYASLERAVKKAAAASDHRITVILPNGSVAADSEQNPIKMENHANRPEVQEAISGKTGISQRYSSTLGKQMLYAAVPVKSNGNVAAVIRCSTPLLRLNEMLHPTLVHLILFGGTIASVAAVISIFLARRVERPLDKLADGARHFAEGDLDFRIAVPDLKEFAQLANTLNMMAAAQSERIAIISAQRNELEAVLSSMVEGVMVVDSGGHIAAINKAAADILNADCDTTVGHRIEEIVYNPQLQLLITEVLNNGGTIEKEIEIYKDKKRYVQIHGTAIDKTEGRDAVIVFNDITRIRRLEDMRREFVSNVSHELKTPITSIKGFVETLLDGAMNDKEETKKFLEIISKHTNRLIAIIEDILTLSHIEQDLGGQTITQEAAPIKIILDEAAEACQAKAAQKQIQITIDCDKGLTAIVNSRLLEQAVINLIDNAVKYSEPNSPVEISATQNSSNILITIRDYGSGISPEHLPRIFERFYVADKARSRKLGGTGLGLAIVKHIISIHRGKISAQSEIGKGSTFTITLPLQ